VQDERGWYHRYTHLYSFDPSVKLGEHVVMGQKIGTLGKEGGSGGWSHLHYEILTLQPSGKLGTQEGYAFLWGSLPAAIQASPDCRHAAAPGSAHRGKGDVGRIAVVEPIAYCALRVDFHRRGESLGPKS